MKLLLLDQFSDMGGAQQVLADLLPAIRQRGWSALAALPEEGELVRRVRAAGFPAERIECGPYASGRKSPGDVARFLMEAPKLARQIRLIAERFEADLVYVNGPRLLPAASLAAVRAPVLFHAHSYLPPGLIRRLAGESLRKARASVVGTCRFVADPWKQFVPAERVSVIYNGVAGPGNRATEARNGAPVIGCIGRIAREKGQREFMVAAAEIQRAMPQSRFLICGAALFPDAAARAYEAEIRAAADGLPVEFAGWVQDVYAALVKLDLLLVPSAAHEATTRVILEAFAAGVPVIAFRSGGIPEVVEDGRTGLLAGSAHEMARLAVELLAGDRARAAAITHAARESWRRQFTLEHFWRRMLDRLERAKGGTEFATIDPGDANDLGDRRRREPS